MVTIPLMYLDSCTLPTREGVEEDKARILALASVTRYGPAYDRAVAENLGKYMHMVSKKDSASAEYFLDRAEKAFEYAREGEEVKEKCTYCQEVMKPGHRFYGDYCPTRHCFNSEGERVLRGPRINRRREEASK